MRLTPRRWYGGLERVWAQTRDAGIDARFPEFAESLFRQTIEAGHGAEHVAALVEVLRRRAAE
jgi:hypothetical protein